MGRQKKYTCKGKGEYPGCKGEIVLSDKVLELLIEKGESRVRWCENCQKQRKAEKRETRQRYIPHDINLPMRGIPRASYFACAYTFHEDTVVRSEECVPDMDDMRIRITDKHMIEIYDLLEKHQVIILASPTGTGKSVFVLYRLLQAAPSYKGQFIQRLIRQGQVIQTQPLTYATSRIPEAVAVKMFGESSPSQTGTLGLRYGGREQYSRLNLGVVVTDGSLKNWIRDGHMGQYSLIMVDEAHKRSVNIDNLLMLLQYKLPLYPHLKVIIASATINLEQFQKAFERQGISTGIMDLSQSLEEQVNYHVHFWQDNAVDKCSCWLCQNEDLRRKFWSGEPPTEAELPSVVSSYVVDMLRNTGEGGILVFLTGEAIILRTAELLESRLKRIKELKDVDVIPIFSRLGGDEVEKRFKRSTGKKRVLLTTDIAETSHTLSDIKYVIESGYIKQHQWDPRDQTSTLPTIRHSKAGRIQRWGRVGRTSEGFVYCLYPKEEHNSAKSQTTAEIFRSPIDETLLNARAAGVARQVEFIGAADDKAMFHLERKRAEASNKHAAYLDEHENVTEDGMDVFRIPISAQKKALLDMADEQGCFIEMLTLLSMIDSDKSDARTGADIFDIHHGLLVWDTRWTAYTKLRVYRIHQALKAGCVDDLDFAIKMAVCYLRAKEKGREGQWAEQNFVNLDAFENIFKEQDSIKDIFLSRAEERDIRPIDLKMIKKIRMILSIVLQGKVVRILQTGETLVYKFDQDQNISGIVHAACTGNWQEGESAILMTATKKLAVLDGQFRPVSHSCSLIKVGPQEQELNEDRFFDQHLMIDTRVAVVAGEGGRYYVNGVLKAPSMINMEMDQSLEFEMIVNDYLRANYKAQIPFDDRQAQGSFAEIKQRVRLVWQDGRTSPEAKIVGWTMLDGVPCAVGRPADERALLRALRQAGSTMAQIIRVFKGPEDGKGWVLTKTEKGLEFPVEISDLCLSFLTEGIKSLEGQRMELYVRDETMHGLPILSNVDNIIDRLQERRKEIEGSGALQLSAKVDKIDRDRNFITAYVLEDCGMIYSFMIRPRNIPKDMRIGQDISVSVELNSKRRFEDCLLGDYESKNLPDEEGWEYDAENERLHYPCFLDREFMRELDFAGLSEKILKASWFYGFWARMSS